MNISGIRTGAGFYDYNSIKINEVRSQQIQEPRESAPHPKEILYVDLSGEADVYDILRKKDE